MDIGTIVSIIGAGKSFLDGGDSGGQEQGTSLLDTRQFWDNLLREYTRK